MSVFACFVRTSTPARRARALLACLGLGLGSALSARAGTDLTTLSLERLMDLTVTGASKYEQKQSEVAAAVSVITRDEIKAFGWRTVDQALASLPGISTTYDRQYYYLGTRGFGLPGDYNTRVLFTINGNRVNDVVYDQGPMGRAFPLDMDLVERIEFIPGPGGAVYGQNAMFGVVNVVTRTGADLAGTELALLHERPQRSTEGRISWGRRLGNGVDLLLSISGLRAHGDDRFFDYGAAGVSGDARGLDGERDKSFFGRVARGPWSFEVAHGNRRKDDPAGAYLSDPLVHGQYQADRYTLAQWQYQESFADDAVQLLGRLFAGRQRYSSILIYGTPFSFPAAGDWHGGELRLLTTALRGHKLMLGIEAQDNTRIDQASLDLAAPANDISISQDGYRVGVYVQDEWRIADPLTATLGLRLDRNNVTGTKASPRAALIWQAAPGTTLKALYGRANRAPNAFERDNYDNVTQVSNRALRGERIDTLELLADHRVDPDLRLRASLYEWRIRDLVTLGVDPASGLSQYRSGDEVHAKGLELSADKTWAWQGRLRASLSLQDVKYAAGTAPVNSPRRLGKLNFSMPVAGASLGYELQYVSQRRTIGGISLGGYAISNLHLSTDRLADGLELGLSIRNLLGKAYDQPGADTNWQDALEQDGRSIGIEARFRF